MKLLVLQPQFTVLCTVGLVTSCWVLIWFYVDGLQSSGMLLALVCLGDHNEAHKYDDETQATIKHTW